MNQYSTILQIGAILFICYVAFLLVQLILSVLRKRRITQYAIHIKHGGYRPIFQFIRHFSEFLEAMVIFNGIARTYDKYTYHDKNLKNGMDYISIKILIGFLFILFYLFVTFLYKDHLVLLMILISFIIGFIVPDFYCIYLESKSRRILNKDILNAIIIMNNGYKAGLSTEQTIEDVTKRVSGPVKYEFIRVLNDIRMGLDVSEAFLRMYERTDIKILLEISHILLLVSKCGSNIVSIFEEIEQKILEEEKFYNEIKRVESINYLSLGTFGLLPLVFISYLLLFNEEYVLMLLDSRGIIVILSLATLYVLYIFILWKIVKGVRKHDKKYE